MLLVSLSNPEPCGCGYKIPSIRFYNRTIVLYRTKCTHFSFHPSKSLPVKFQQMNSRGGQKQSKGTSQTRSYQGSQHIKTPSITSIVTFKNQRKPITQFRPSIHPSTHHLTPHHTHPEERIWAGRTPRAPDAPKIKHDKMKQFYMVDMGRKM